MPVVLDEAVDLLRLVTGVLGRAGNSEVHSAGSADDPAPSVAILFWHDRAACPLGAVERTRDIRILVPSFGNHSLTVQVAVSHNSGIKSPSRRRRPSVAQCDISQSRLRDDDMHGQAQRTASAGAAEDAHVRVETTAPAEAEGSQVVVRMAHIGGSREAEADRNRTSLPEILGHLGFEDREGHRGPLRPRAGQSASAGSLSADRRSDSVWSPVEARSSQVDGTGEAPT